MDPRSRVADQKSLFDPRSTDFVSFLFPSVSFFCLFSQKIDLPDLLSSIVLSSAFVETEGGSDGAGSRTDRASDAPERTILEPGDPDGVDRASSIRRASRRPAVSGWPLLGVRFIYKTGYIKIRTKERLTITPIEIMLETLTRYEVTLKVRN